MGIIVVVAFVLLIGGIFAFTTFGSKAPKKAAVTPTPSVSFKEVDSSVQASLTPNPAKTKVTLEITGLGGKYSQIEYELTYQTENHGAQGAFSPTPIALDPGADTFSREIELGSCSTGGKCTYDKGVKDFQLSAKFHLPNGEVQILKKTFASI